jgi:hypothetical protein
MDATATAAADVHITTLTDAKASSEHHKGSPFAVAGAGRPEKSLHVRTCMATHPPTPRGSTATTDA